MSEWQFRIIDERGSTSWLPVYTPWIGHLWGFTTSEERILLWLISGLEIVQADPGFLLLADEEANRELEIALHP